MSIRDEIEQAEKDEDLARTCQRLQRQLVKAKAKNADLIEAVERAAHDAARIAGYPPSVKFPAKRKEGGNKHAETALLHLTDWQLGKETSSYSTDVCKERVMRVVAKTLRLTEIQRAAHPVDEIIVMLGGDMIENIQTFPGQPFEVDSTLFGMVFEAANLIEAVLLELLRHFKVVRVYEVAGNHGRIGKKTDGVPDNWDRILCRIVRDRLSQDRLVWHEPSSWYEIVEAGAYRAMLVHGDQIKSFGGNTPAFGIIRKSTAWSSGIVEAFDDVYLGHYHHVSQFQLPNGGRVFMTGSTESGSEYAREFVAAKGRPSQRLHFIDPDAGRVTAEYIIWLD
jgi:hypothetical protein